MRKPHVHLSDKDLDDAIASDFATGYVWSALAVSHLVYNLIEVGRHWLLSGWSGHVESHANVLIVSAIYVYLAWPGVRFHMLSIAQKLRLVTLTIDE